MEKKKLVKEIFNIESFKEYQSECFESLLMNRDCFVCQPTGSGKSIIFQAFPFLSYLNDHKDIKTKEELLKRCSYKTLVISPLVSLMKDQEQYLNSKGIVTSILSHDSRNKEYEIEVCLFIFYQTKLVVLLASSLTEQGSSFLWKSGGQRDVGTAMFQKQNRFYLFLLEAIAVLGSMLIYKIDFYLF